MFFGSKASLMFFISSRYSGRTAPKDSASLQSRCRVHRTPALSIPWICRTLPQKTASTSLSHSSFGKGSLRMYKWRVAVSGVAEAPDPDVELLLQGVGILMNSAIRVLGTTTSPLIHLRGGCLYRSKTRPADQTASFLSSVSTINTSMAPSSRQMSLLRSRRFQFQQGCCRQRSAEDKRRRNCRGISSQKFSAARITSAA